MPPPRCAVRQAIGSVQGVDETLKNLFADSNKRPVGSFILLYTRSREIRKMRIAPKKCSRQAKYTDTDYADANSSILCLHCQLRNGNARCNAFNSFDVHDDVV